MRLFWSVCSLAQSPSLSLVRSFVRCYFASIHLKFHYADEENILCACAHVCGAVHMEGNEKHIIRIIFHRLWIVFCIVVAHFPPNLIQFKFIRNCFSVVFVFHSLCFTFIFLCVFFLALLLFLLLTRAQLAGVG